MESKGLTRAIVRSYAVTGIVALALWPLWDGVHALGLLFGGVWSAANIWAIKGLVEEICNARRVVMIAVFAQLKLPILYGIGAAVLLAVPLSVGASIAGFHIPFAVIVVEAVVYGNQKTHAAGVL